MLDPSRRSFCAIAALAPLVACGRGGDASVLRLGFFPNITHAPALTGLESGRFAAAVRPVRIEPHSFNAGPAAMEAVLADAIDVAYLGPSPAVAGYLRTHGQAVRVVAGAASGGTSFVVRPEANIHGPADLHGKRLATPQLGNTQDVALRIYLRSHGLAPTERGGDVNVTPLANPDILAQFRLGHLDGAWVPEPWATRLIAEAGGVQLFDERDLWPDHRFAITVIVAHRRFLERSPAVLESLLRAHVAEVAWLGQHPDEARALCNRAMGRLIGRPLPDAVLAAAWPHMEFTTDPMRASLEQGARSAQSLGFLPAGDVSGLIDPTPLARATAAAR